MVIFVYVPDVDATVERAVANGVVRRARSRTNSGVIVSRGSLIRRSCVPTVASRIEDTSAAERTPRWDKILEEGQ